MSRGTTVRWSATSSSTTNEIVFFGLTPEFIGRRVGPWLLDRAIERGLARGSSRLILNTNTVDHPRALDTYRKAGFRIVGREAEGAAGPPVAVAGHLSVAAEVIAVP